MFVKIINRLFEHIWIVAKQSKRTIAVITKQSANLSRCMVMVNSQRLHMTIVQYYFWFIAYCTKIVLFLNKRIVDININAKISLESSLDVIKLNPVNIFLVPFSASYKTAHLTNALQSASGMFMLEKIFGIFDLLATETPFLPNGNLWTTAMFPAMTNNISKWLSLNPALLLPVSWSNGNLLSASTLTRSSGDFLKRKLFHGFSHA